MSANPRAFQLALNGGVSDLMAMIASKEVAPNAVQQSGMYRGFSLLHLAASKGHASVADMLLRAGASALPTNTSGKTAAQLAADKGHIALAGHLRAAETAPSPALARQARQHGLRHSARCGRMCRKDRADVAEGAVQQMEDGLVTVMDRGWV